jgi:hypothetical protein
MYLKSGAMKLWFAFKMYNSFHVVSRHSTISSYVSSSLEFVLLKMREMIMLLFVQQIAVLWFTNLSMMLNASGLRFVAGFDIDESTTFSYCCYASTHKTCAMVDRCFCKNKQILSAWGL